MPRPDLIKVITLILGAESCRSSSRGTKSISGSNIATIHGRSGAADYMLLRKML